MPEPVLFVDSELRSSSWPDELTEHGFRPVRIATWDDARAFVQQHGRALLITRATDTGPDPEALALAEAFLGVELVFTANDAMATVVERLRRAARHRDTRLELERLRSSVDREQGFEHILGTSPPMKELFALLHRAAATRATVLISGESGTGKELVARALHMHGPLHAGPFVAINCSAVPEPLLESELFGHVKGAFTDAKASRVGLFVKAHGGTLFLDEIGDMPVALQPKLLRALQERTIRPVGGDTETAVHVRMIAATNRDLDEAVRSGSFREDLFYRLNVIRIDVPPLRSRASDILLLAHRFTRACAVDLGKDVSGLSRGAEQRLLAHGWPGNVRELQNCIEHAVALTRDDQLQVADLPAKVRGISPPATALPLPDELVPLEEIERRYIEHVLVALKGNKRAAARVLGLDRKTLYRKLMRYRIGWPDGGTTDARPMSKT